MKQRRVNKAFLHEYDEALALSTERKFRALSERTISLLLVLCEYISWPTRWYSKSDPLATFDRDTLQRWAAEATYQLTADVLVSGCANIPLTDITWYPTSPYTGGELPPGYLFDPWTIVEDASIGSGLGFPVGSVWTDISKLPVLPNSIPPTISVLNDWPRVSVSVSGVGVMRASLLNVPQGGVCIIIVDGDINPLNWQFVDVNRDITQLPPETPPTIDIETVVSGTGPHTIDYRLFVTVNDQAIPISFGGGFARFEWCGDDATTDTDCCDGVTEALSEVLEAINDML